MSQKSTQFVSIVFLMLEHFLREKQADDKCLPSPEKRSSQGI